jgi:hypothetical protein
MNDSPLAGGEKSPQVGCCAGDASGGVPMGRACRARAERLHCEGKISAPGHARATIELFQPGGIVMLSKALFLGLNAGDDFGSGDVRQRGSGRRACRLSELQRKEAAPDLSSVLPIFCGARFRRSPASPATTPGRSHVTA